MTISEAVKILGLVLPTTPNACKTTFRRLSRLEHPDLSKHPDAAARFGRIKEAYDLLLPTLESANVDVGRLVTDGGVPLSELGQGLGPTVNGVGCGECKGLGFRTFEDRGRRYCPDCIDVLATLFGRRHDRCRKCHGSGRFVKNGRDQGICFSCSGRGRYERICPTCKGTRIVGSAEPKFRYVRCEACEGCGEIRIFNPVLPKGLLL